jgi:hypothetical protein
MRRSDREIRLQNKSLVAGDRAKTGAFVGTALCRHAGNTNNSSRRSEVATIGVRSSRENQFHSSDKENRCQKNRNHSDSKTPAAQMRPYSAANDRGCGKDETKRRNQMNFCKITNQTGNRVDPNEQRRNSGGLSNVRPAAKQQ